MTTFALILAAVAASFDVSLAACTNPRERSEWSTLSSDQKQAYVQAVADLAARPASGQYADPSRMGWHDFVITHSRNAYWAHGNAQFYPYHRAMMWQYEEAIISTGKWPSSMGVPFFDWTAMSQNWWTSDIFTPSNFGAITSSDTDRCVLDGVFAKGKYNVAPDADGHRIVAGNPTCLRRNANKSPLPDAVMVSDGLRPTTYTEFTGFNLDESNFHASGHGTFGGDGSDMANPSVSPNDPIFWLHHGLVDKYWWRWQQRCEAFKYDYDGRLARGDDPVSVTGTDKGTKDLFVDSWPFRVEQLLDTQGETLCYTYAKSGGDVNVPSVKCPPFVKPTAAIARPSAIPTGDFTVTGTTTSAAVALATSTQSVNPIDDVWMVKALVGLVAKRKIAFKTAPEPTRTGASVVAAAAADVGSGSMAQEEVFVFGRDVVNATRTLDAWEMATGTMQQTGTTIAAATGTVIATATDTLFAIFATVTPILALPRSTFNTTTSVDNTTITVSFSHSNKTIEVPANYTIVAVYPSSLTSKSADGRLKRFFPETPKIEYEPTPGAPATVEVGTHPCYLAYPEPVTREWAETMNMNYDMMMAKHNILKMKIDAYNAHDCKDSNGTSPSSLSHFGWNEAK
ncbi:hypothetical protein BC830DRAFT_1185877 [Chytriomyces sp. MP71]|nr:hypothetical protein BC830DRAFT_1185877 [Chytriomyces sp. MP71]